jgi:hypothetical protein
MFSFRQYPRAKRLLTSIAVTVRANSGNLESRTQRVALHPRRNTIGFSKMKLKVRVLAGQNSEGNGRRIVGSIAGARTIESVRNASVTISKTSAKVRGYRILVIFRAHFLHRRETCRSTKSRD